MAGADWKFGLFGCLGDSKLCILTFLVPCYTVGKNAESFGEDCLIHGLLFALGLNFGSILRWRLREKHGIAGTMLLDVLTQTVCPCCALVQEARQVGWNMPKDFNDIGRREDQSQNQTIDRE